MLLVLPKNLIPPLPKDRRIMDKKWRMKSDVHIVGEGGSE